MMSFNSFTVARNDYNFGAQCPNGRCGRFFLPANKTFEDICLAFAGKFPQKELWIVFVFKRACIWKPCRAVYRPSLRFPSYLAHICALTNWLSMWNSLAQNSIVLKKFQSNGSTAKRTKISCRNDLMFDHLVHAK